MDFILDLALSEDLDTMFTATLLNSDEEAVGRMMQDENAIVSLSDAGAHLTFLCDAGFGLHVLGHWARDRKGRKLSAAHFAFMRGLVQGLPEERPGHSSLNAPAFIAN